MFTFDSILLSALRINRATRETIKPTSLNKSLGTGVFVMELREKMGLVENETLRPSDLQRRLKKNCEELSAVLESEYLPYLKPQTIAKIQTIVGRK